MDLLDSQLINILTQDANTSSSVLAKKLNVSSSTVRRRKRSLLDQGMIRILAVPDWNKVGLPLAAIIALDVSGEKIKLELLLRILRDAALNYQVSKQTKPFP